MSWLRGVVVAIALIAIVALIIHAVGQLQLQLARLTGGKAVAPEAPTYADPYSIARTFIPPMIVAAISAIAVRAIIERRRLMGVIRFRDLQRHLLLFGPTGSGKTSTALKAIELSIRNGVPVDVLDWKGEYVEKIRGATVIKKVKLLEPPDWSNVQSHVLVVVDILRDVLELTEPMSFMLYEELTRMYESGKASFTTLLEQLRARRAVAIANRYGAEANIAEGLIRRILPLVLDERREAKNLRGDERVTIYDLSELPTYQLKTLYAEILLWRLYNEARSKRVMGYGLRKLVVCEEAQNYVRPRRHEQPPSIGERVVNELRAYGYGFLLIAPDPDQLPYHMAKDAGAVISIGYQGLPEVVAELLSFYRYADIKRLIKTTSRPRTYIYYNGRLYIKGAPKPYLGTLNLGVEAEPAPAVMEEAVEKEEERPEPIGGAHHRLTPRSGPWPRARGFEDGGGWRGGGADEAAPRRFTAPPGRSGPLRLEEESVEEAEELPREHVEAEEEEAKAAEAEEAEGGEGAESVEEVPPLELEEEEGAEELPPLRLEAEEAEAVEEAKPSEPVKVVEERPKIYRIGDHAVQEAVVEGQPVTWLRCIVCGAEAPLTELARLKERPCRLSKKEGEAERVEEERGGTGICEYCGGEAVGKYPAAGIEVSLCSRCLEKYEEFYLKARPSISQRDPVTNKVRSVRVKHPLDLLERAPKIAWVNELATWFVEEDGRWPCPACGEKFNRLADAIRHFAERHPERPRWEREYVNGLGEVPRTWQGYVCPKCGLFEKDVELLKLHYRNVHGGGPHRPLGAHLTYLLWGGGGSSPRPAAGDG